VIVVEHLHFVYPDGSVALRDVSLRISEGETVGLIGPNGAGKSTLLLQLNGLLGLRGRTGRVLINGREVIAPHLAEIRREVGFLFQDPDDQLFSATVEEDVAFGPLQLGVLASEVSQRVAEALAATHLTGLETRMPCHLSLGEKKRVCLAGVWACQPSVLVFDEPTANFDPRGRREFITLCRSFRATKLIASHDLEMILALCDRVILLDAGQVIADGDAKSILSDEPLMLAHGLEKPHSLLHHHPHSHYTRAD
jgi:energy-coupling factor transporter ATP-binding protein EcfA2